MEEVLSHPVFWKFLAVVVTAIVGTKQVQEMREKAEDWNLKRLVRTAEVVLTAVHDRAEDASDPQEPNTEAVKKAALTELRAKLEVEAPRLARTYTDDALRWAIAQATPGYVTPPPPRPDPDNAKQATDPHTGTDSQS